MKKSVPRGRPRKSAIMKLKVMAWFNAVAQASGKTAAELEREFADPSHIRRSKDKNKEIRPGLWDKYRRGEVEPRALPSKGKSLSVVQAVEAKYPGTAKVLTLPLWRLLDFSQPVTMEELEAIQNALSTGIHRLHADENALGRELSRVESSETELPSPQRRLCAVIQQSTLNAISVRHAMHNQQEAIFGLMRTHLDATTPRKKNKIP